MRRPREREFLAGYRVYDRCVKVKEVTDVKPSLVMKSIRPVSLKNDYSRRAMCSVSLGCQLKQACPPKPDKDGLSLARGLQARLGWQPKPMPRALKRKIKFFVSTWCKKNLAPIAKEELLTFDGWINKIIINKTYPASRIKELKQVWQDHLPYVNPDGTLKDNINKKLRYRWFSCKSFVKEEHYAVPGWKHPRAINSRSDFFKCLVGPYFDRVSEAVFKWAPEGGPSPFIKYVPVRDRPYVVKSHLERHGAKYRCTDFSSYEAHFTKEMMEICEFELYKWMASRNAYCMRVVHLLETVLQGKNIMDFKWFKVAVDATRMSGEMNTSLGNGFSNLMIQLFIVHCKNKHAVWKGFVEGDDALATIDPPDASPEVADYEALGMNMKEVLSFDDLGEAGFCGMLFSPDDPNLTVVTDVKKVLAKTGWSNMQYVQSNNRTLNALLRNRAYSIAYSYAGCPILDRFGQYLLRCTNEDIVKQKQLIDRMDNWERQQMLLLMSSPVEPREPHRSTRELVERLYGITIDVQEKIECYFDGLLTLQPIDVELDWPDSWVTFRREYTMFVRDDYNCVSEIGNRQRAERMVDDMVQLSPTFSKLQGGW